MKMVCLLSGGIDSPVAGWMMAKRGMEIEAVHFYSYPYTSERAKDKVISLAKILSRYCYRIKLHIVPFTEIQLEINNKCPEDQLTIIMRRAMMIIAERLAVKNGAQALITGESLGQEVVKFLTFGQAVLELSRFPLQLVVRKRGDILFKRVDLVYDRPQAFQIAFVLRAEDRIYK
jgi:tRNA(Ile)-lysidine synthase TilS/MesJ